jgi:hypothetical protein
MKQDRVWKLMREVWSTLEVRARVKPKVAKGI